MEGLSADSLISTFKVIRAWNTQKGNARYWWQFYFRKFKNFCNSLNLEQEISSSYHHQSNRHVEACIMFTKCTMKKCFNYGSDVHIALLYILTTPLGQGLPSPAKLLSIHLVRGVMPVIDCSSPMKRWWTIDPATLLFNHLVRGIMPVIKCSSSMKRWGTIDPWNH